MAIHRILNAASSQGFRKQQAYSGTLMGSGCGDCCRNIALPVYCCLPPGGGKDDGKCCLIILALGALFSALVVAADALKKGGEATTHLANAQALESENCAETTKADVRWVNRTMLLNKSVHSLGELSVAFGLGMAMTALIYYSLYLHNSTQNLDCLVNAKYWAIRAGLVSLVGLTVLAINQVYWKYYEEEFEIKCQTLTLSQRLFSKT